MTRFLKFESEAQAKESLADYVSEGNWLTASHDHALDPVGIISKPTGEMVETEEGIAPVYAPIAGWHVNFIGELTPEVEAFRVTPINPTVVFG